MTSVWFELDTSKIPVWILTTSAGLVQRGVEIYLKHSIFQYISNKMQRYTIAAGSSNGLINTRCCRYSCLRSWWWVRVPPETCRTFSRKINCATLHLVGCILQYRIVFGKFSYLNLGHVIGLNTVCNSIGVTLQRGEMFIELNIEALWDLHIL